MKGLTEISTNLGTTVQVSEHKKLQIEKIMDMASQCSQIEYVILFGSSLTEQCGEDSDVDIVIVSKSTVTELSRNKRYRAYWDKIYEMDNFKTDYDVLYFHSYEDIIKKKDKAPICKEILDKGCIIYAKEGCA